jgi:hypothetical protein
MKSIHHLELDNNGFKGTLPATYAEKRSPETLSLAYNALTGCAPNPLLPCQPARTGACCNPALHTALWSFTWAPNMSAAGIYRPPGRN